MNLNRKTKLGLQTQSGMTLIQVLIAVALLAVVSLGIASLNGQFLFANNNMRAQSGRTAIQSVVTKVLSQKQLCDNFINTGAVINLPSSVPGVTNLTLDLHDDPAASTVVGSNSVLSKYEVGVAPNGFTFTIPTGTTGNPTSAPLPPGKVWTGYVDLQLRKLQQAAGGTDLKKHSIGTLQLLVDPSNQILACEGFLADSSEACASLGGTWSGSLCNFPYTYPCTTGQILTGPTAANCQGCPANQVLVFDGAGGFNCLPYP